LKQEKKKMEHLFKKIPYGDEVSVVPPLQYSERFYNFIKNLLPQTETEEMLIEKEVPSPSTSVITSKKKKRKKQTTDIYAKKTPRSDGTDSLSHSSLSHSTRAEETSQ